jgi:hypothetical protein
MFGKPMVLSQLWLGQVPPHTTLYAFSFCSSSYTLVATVCRFFPSQSLGLFSVGLRSCKERTSLPYYAESRLGLWLGIGRGGERLPRSLEAGHMLSERAGTLARFRGPRRVAWGFAPRIPSLGPATPIHVYRPKIEGYDYVGKSFSFS